MVNGVTNSPFKTPENRNAEQKLKRIKRGKNILLVLNV